MNDAHIDTAAAQARPECVCHETSIRNCSLHANPSCPTCGCPLDVEGGTSLYWFDVAATAEAGEMALDDANREWHQRFVHCDQERSRVASERKKLAEALWECMKAAGADTSYADNAEHAYALGESGHPTLAVAAVEAVQELRNDYEADPDSHSPSKADPEPASPESFHDEGEA